MLNKEKVSVILHPVSGIQIPFELFQYFLLDL